VKSIYLFGLLLTYLACKVEPSSPQTNIEGVYEVTKIIFDKNEIPLTEYQSMIVISLDAENRGSITFNTNKGMMQASSTQSVKCEFVKKDNIINVYDIEKQAVIGNIAGNQLHLFETKKNFESERLAIKSLNLE
jgi:hypothetical protein